jgi:hypothetical protein
MLEFSPHLGFVARMHNNAMRIRHEVGRKVAGDTILQECCNPGTWNVIRRVVTFLRDHATNLTARKAQTARMRRKMTWPNNPPH